METILFEYEYRKSNIERHNAGNIAFSNTLIREYS